jgi:hypothetical protein
MVFDAGLASRFSNIGALEELPWSALSWWHGPAKSFLKAWRKGGVL